MLVKELMTSDVQTCQVDDLLDVPARIMWEADVGCVPVLDAGSRLAGMITDRDICMAAYTQGLPLAAIRVTTAMSPQVVSCRPEDTLEEAARLLQRHRIHRLPVADDAGKLVGILSLNDLARLAATQGVPRRGAYEITEMLASICEPRWARRPPVAATAEARRRPVPLSRSAAQVARGAANGD